jgi:putative oxidoreductase
MFDFSKISKVDVAKVLLLSLYFVSGVMKFKDLKGTANMIKGVGLPFSEIIAFLAASLLVVAPIIIMKEKRNSTLVKYSVYALIIFTLWATYLYHNAFVNPAEKYHFMKNMSIIGGLLLI